MGRTTTKVELISMATVTFDLLDENDYKMKEIATIHKK